MKAGGDLTLISGSDQHYQAAKLQSGEDLTLQSGGEIVFEGVKDLHQESHEKTNNSSFWMSSKGKGNTDETHRQTQMVAEGTIAIHAVNGLKIDVTQVNQQTVSQSIDAMVKADPQLAWLKDAEKRGDVDWQQVKEIHDSFKYSNSGLGPASQMIIAIVMASVVGPLAATAAGGGVPGAVVGALASSAANNATVSVINNRGNLGAVVKDVTSSDAIKGYITSGVTAGLTAGLFDGWTGTKTVSSTGVVSVSPGSLSTWTGVGQFAANQALQSSTSALLSKALGQGGDIGDALKGALFNTLAATSFNAIGDFTQGKLAEGYPPKIIIHAMVGGLLSQATGGDFKTGALAAGINEALVVHLNDLVKGNKILLSMSSQIVGVLAAASQKDADAKSIEKGGWIAKNATDYNYLLHEQVEKMLEEIDSKKTEAEKREVRERYAQINEESNKALRAACKDDPKTCESLSGKLIEDEPKLRELARSLSAQGRLKEAAAIVVVIIGDNTTAGLTIASELQALREGKDSSFWTDSAATLLGSVLGGGKPTNSAGGQKASTGPKVPPKLEALSNPPQGPVIPSGWVSRPGKTPGSTIYYSPGSDPSAPGSTYIRLMPAGSTPVPGLEHGYWISVKNGQPINPATGGTGTRGDTHVPLPPNTVPPKR